MNPEKIDEIEAGGLEFVGRDESGLRMEIAEIPRKYDYLLLCLFCRAVFDHTVFISFEVLTYLFIYLLFFSL